LRRERLKARYEGTLFEVALGDYDCGADDLAGASLTGKMEEKSRKEAAMLEANLKQGKGSEALTIKRGEG